MKTIPIMMGLALVLAGCATAARDVAATPFDDSVYDDWTCAKITDELIIMTSRVDILSAEQEYRRTAIIMPDGGGASVLSRLKGQRDALIRVSERKRCAEQDVARLRSGGG